MYQSIPTDGGDASTSGAPMDVPCWNLTLTVFSLFRELELLDFSGNYACLQNFDGMYLLFVVCMELKFCSSSMFEYYSEANNSSGLQGLSKLKYLNLSDNTFIGSIPGSVSKLVSLEVINLSRNNMSGALQNTGTQTNRFNIPFQLVPLNLTCYNAWQVLKI
jgi:hypothetical protein